MTKPTYNLFPSPLLYVLRIEFIKPIYTSREGAANECVYARAYRQYLFNNESFTDNEESCAVERDANTEISRFFAQQRLQV